MNTDETISTYVTYTHKFVLKELEKKALNVIGRRHYHVEIVFYVDEYFCTII